MNDKGLNTKIIIYNFEPKLNNSVLSGSNELLFDETMKLKISR